MLLKLYTIKVLDKRRTRSEIEMGGLHSEKRDCSGLTSVMVGERS
jgi:hypothetical protein